MHTRGTWHTDIAKKLATVAQTVRSVDRSADKSALGLAVWHALAAFRPVLTAAPDDAAAAPVVTALKALLTDTPGLSAAEKQDIDALFVSPPPPPITAIVAFFFVCLSPLRSHAPLRLRQVDTSSNNLGVAEVPTKSGLLRLIKKK